MRVFSRQELAEAIELIGADGFCANIADIARSQAFQLTAPENISTVECAEKYRYFRSPEGDAKFLWSRKRTPYLVGVMDALDNANTREVIMPKPGRSGGTAAFECYEFKRMRFGPMTDMGIYLGSDSEVDNYCDKGFKYLFEDHPEIRDKLGSNRSDDKLKSKRVAGRTIEVLQANNKTVTGRQFGWMRVDEIDTFGQRLRSTMLEQSRIRGRQLGSWRKVGITSHPDAGWESGVAAAWTQSSQGIYVMRCPNCGGHGSPYPTKFWPDVPRFRLHYRKMPEGARWSLSKRLQIAEATAAMRCPHCESDLDDKQRFAMVDEGQWMEQGQHLDIEAGIIGVPDDNPARGFWIHGLMVKAITNAELARDLEGAIEHHQRTRKTDKLREVLAKVFGEVFEGTGSGAGAAELSKRAAAARTDDVTDEHIFSIGRCPGEAWFITAAVDPGHGKFDISFRGWDLESRSWWIDRDTLTDRVGRDGVRRKIRPPDRIDDWDVLIDAVIDRKFPIIGRPGWFMPVAAVAIDCGDGNVTWKAREFARRMSLAGKKWRNWDKVRLIKGAKSKDAPELPVTPRKISKDEHGNLVEPVILEYDLGVHKLKELSVERLGIDDGGPGQCTFAEGVALSYFEEFFGERLIDGKWVRSGPNESLDLFGYEEAIRLMLRPDHKDIKWDEGKLPPWAKPVPDMQEGGDPAVAGGAGQVAEPSVVKKPSIYERYNNLHGKPKRDG